MLPTQATGARRALRHLGSAIATCLALFTTLGTAHAITADELLEPQEAFPATIMWQAPQQLLIEFIVAADYYLYGDKFRFVSETPGITLGQPILPAGQVIEDPYFGEVTTHRRVVSITVPYQQDATAPSTLNVAAYSQGCADVGVCYQPYEQTLSLTLPAGASGAASTSGAATAATERPADNTQLSLGDSSFIATVLLFLGFGLLLSLTPCVLPMVPLVSSLVIGAGDKKPNGRRALALSLTYVLSLSAVYALAGVISARSGQSVQTWFQQPLIIIAFTLLLVAMALAMFNVYTLQMPAAWQSRLSGAQGKYTGTLWGAAIMGALSALIVGPCISAPMVSALVYVADSGNMLLGGSALFALGFGTGLPLIIAATSAGRWLPKTGSWMRQIQAALGFSILALAIWMLDRIVPTPITLALAALLAVGLGIYLRALEPLGPAPSGWRVLQKTLGIFLLLYATLLLLGALGNSQNYLQPLSGFGSPAQIAASAQPDRAAFTLIKSTDDLEHALDDAVASNRMTMLNFHADWCITCKEMEAFTLSVPKVQAQMASLVLLEADVTANDAQDRALLKKFKLFGPPAILFFDAQGNEITHARIYGYLSAEDFIEKLQQL